MRIVTPTVAAAVLAAQPAMLSAQETTVLEPTSNWNLDYGTETCRLGRSFGEGDSKVILILSKYSPGIGMEMMATGKLLKANSSRKFTYSFHEGDEIDVERPLFGELEGDETIWQFSGELIPSDVLEDLSDADAGPQEYKEAEAKAAAEAKRLTLNIGRSTSVALNTGKLSAAIEAMDACTHELVRSWGYDPEALAKIATGPEPVGRITSWFNASDYPAEALRKNLSGAVRFRLGVDDDGQIENCTIQSSYSDPSFPEKVCSEFQRKGKFEPARDAEGNPVASYWASTVVFVTR